MKVHHARGRHLYQRVWCMLTLRKESRTVLQKYFNTASVTTVILQSRRLVKRVFNVSIILIHDSSNCIMMSPVTGAEITETQCALFQHNRLLN